MHAQNANNTNHEPEWLDAGEYLKREMARKGHNAASLAKEAGNITAQAIYNVTGATKRPITRNLAHVFATHLGGSIEFWLSNRFPNYATNPAAAAGLGPRPQGILVDRRLRELNGSDENGFIISPFDEKLIQGASIDLTMGLFVTQGFPDLSREMRDCLFSLYQLDLDEDQFTADQQRHFTTLRDDNGLVCASDISLRPGKSTIVVAAQYVRMGRGFLGFLGQTNEANLKGLVVHCGHQIDPGFNGPLIFRVKNDSDDNLTLKRGDLLASITVTALPEAVTQGYEKNPASQIRGVINRLYRAFEDHTSIKSSGGGYHLTYSDQTFSGVSRKSAIAAFLTWGESQLDGGGLALDDLFARVEVADGDIANLGAFLVARKTSVAFAVSQAAANEKARRFDRVVSNLTDSRSEIVKAYRDVWRELRGFVSNLNELGGRSEFE